jgi:hypothetical protein
VLVWKKNRSFAKKTIYTNAKQKQGMNKLCFDLQQYISGYLGCRERTRYKRVSKQWHFVLTLHSPGVKCEPLVTATLVNVYDLCRNEILRGFVAMEIPDGVIFWQSCEELDGDQPLFGDICYTKYIKNQRTQHGHGYHEFCHGGPSVFQSEKQCMLLSSSEKLKIIFDTQ